MGTGQKRLLRGLSSFEARALALIILLLLVFPSVSKASSENPDLSIVIFGNNVSVRGNHLNFTVEVKGKPLSANLTWILPPGFFALGPVEEVCVLPCNKTLEVFVNQSSAVGNLTVGVEAEYE